MNINLHAPIIFMLLLLTGMLSSCKKNMPDMNRTPILEVEGKFLYEEQFEQVVPQNISKKDSVDIAKKYIKKWVTDVLMYENAKRNVTNQSEIDDMVEEYRKTLTIHQYQQKMMEERLPKELSDEEIFTFYSKYSKELILKETVIKGLLLIVPLNAPKVANVRSWVQSASTKSLESIEKYSIRNAISYDYFGDRWIPISEIIRKIPIKITDPNAFASSSRFVETQDSTQRYFLHIQSYKKSGQVEPIEMAKERISTILLNKHKADFMLKFENELYQDAIDDEIVTFLKRKK
jgi:hypothetical protein